MKQFISEEFVDFKLLTPKQAEEVERARVSRETAFNNLLSSKQNELIEREDDLMERMAKAAGFDGYDTGECNYKDVYRKILYKDASVDEGTREKYNNFNQSKWNGMFSNEYFQLSKLADDIKTFESNQKVWLKQQHLNDVLTATRPRAEKYKFDNGTRFPNVTEYNKLSLGQKVAFRIPVTDIVTTADYNELLVDASISGKLLRLWGMGVKTGASCSGMVQDHPYHRYEENDRFGRYKKGELMFLKPRTPRAYITFPVEENHPDMIAKTQQMAEKWGWVVDRQDIYGKNSIVLRPPHTLDGSSYTQISKEIEEGIEGIMAQYGLTDEAEAREDSRRNVEFNHGGRIMYTDRMLAFNWRQMVEGIGNIMYQIKRETLKKNIEEGKAVKVYNYDSRFATLNAEQLADIFRRSDIILDKASIPSEGLKGIGDEIWRMPRFLVSEGKARLMGNDEPMPDESVLMFRQNLSQLMAKQIKGTVHTSEPEPYEYKMTVMIHPDPQTIEQVERFNFTKNIGQHEFYNSYNDNYDFTLILADKFKDELYQAALDAYEHNFLKKIDDVKNRQAVSDIRIRKGMDGNTYISCHVYGEKQLAKRMKPVDADYYRMRMAASDKAFDGVAPELAHKYYKNEIEAASQQQEHTKGMSR